MPLIVSDYKANWLEDSDGIANANKQPNSLSEDNSHSDKKDILRASSDSISRRTEFILTLNTNNTANSQSAVSLNNQPLTSHSTSKPIAIGSRTFWSSRSRETIDTGSSAAMSSSLPPLETSGISATLLNGAIITSSPKSETPRKSSQDIVYQPSSSPFTPAPHHQAHTISSKAADDAGGLTLPTRAHGLHPHRLSSPPRFSAPAQASTYPYLSETPQRPPAVHRHTLEVPPRISTSPRNSKDAAPGSARSDDIMFPNGGLSPHSGRGLRKPSLSISRWTPRSNFDALHHTADETSTTPIEEQRRRMRRRRRDEEDDDRVIVGTKVDQNHVNWITAYNMLTGIRFVVSRTNAKIKPKEIQDFHYTQQNKFSFDVTGNELTPSAKYDFKFKDYAPEVFRDLRDIFGLDPGDYLISLTAKYILSELGSPGKSGSFFYFSRDYKYIIKTIHHSEHVLLRRILKQYHEHVKANPNTLLSQFYGLHRVKVAYGKKIHFVVMNNLFPPHRDIHRTFDLKGSTVGRYFKEEDLEKTPRAVLKDLNWLRRKLHFEFGPSKKSTFIHQMEKDVALLKSLKIMDYSLLVGIHDLGKGNDEKLRDRTLQVFSPGGDQDQEPHGSNSGNAIPLHRTASKMENIRKAKELRQNLKTQRPIPIGSSTSRMPDELPDDETSKKSSVFYSDDGGYRATHNDDSPGEEIYYLGIIDCLTKYNFVKRSEHFFKGMTQNEAKISAIPPDRYGDRFINFISRVTMPRENQSEREKASEELKGEASDRGRRTIELSGSEIEPDAGSSEANVKANAPPGDDDAADIAEGGEVTATLPVVEEAPGEASSTDEREGHDHGHGKQKKQDAEEEEEEEAAK